MGVTKYTVANEQPPPVRVIDNSAVLKAQVAKLKQVKESRDAAAVPDVPFQMLTALDLGSAHWAQIARTASWQTTRMNLNTFARHGVFADPDLTRLIAERLRDPEKVRKARVFPYQLLAAFMNVSAEVPGEVKEALQDAMETATQNVPSDVMAAMGPTPVPVA